jgi:hypothetical protein
MATADRTDHAVADGSAPPSVPPVTTPRDAVTNLALGAAALTIGLTAVTFWLSYAALHDLAATHQLIGVRSWAWPATIDAFVIVGEVLILRASLLHRIDWLAVFLVASGSITSIILNVASVGATANRTSQVVAAVPPVAALLAFTALMRQLYRALAPAVERITAPTAADEPLTADLTRTAPPVTAAVAAQPMPVMPPVPAAPPTVPALPAPAQPAAPAPAAIVYSDPRCAVLRALYNDGTRPGTKAMRAAIADAGFPVPSDGTIRGGLRKEIELHEPHLANYPAAIAA